MACPLYSTREQECLLLNVAAIEDDEDVVAEADRVRREWCLAGGKGYSACPVYRHRAVERTKAF